ncbi:hypothetical protein HK101_006554 [Irineochytrium annulatum]|nr:hypothetical protein HK101_006554 [Irineochytrium annulatum]
MQQMEMQTPLVATLQILEAVRPDLQPSLSPETATQAGDGVFFVRCTQNEDAGSQMILTSSPIHKAQNASFASVPSQSRENGTLDAVSKLSPPSPDTNAHGGDDATMMEAAALETPVESGYATAIPLGTPVRSPAYPSSQPRTKWTYADLDHSAGTIEPSTNAAAVEANQSPTVAVLGDLITPAPHASTHLSTFFNTLTSSGLRGGLYSDIAVSAFGRTFFLHRLLLHTNAYLSTLLIDNNPFDKTIHIPSSALAHTTPKSLELILSRAYDPSRVPTALSWDNGDVPALMRAAAVFGDWGLFDHCLRGAVERVALCAGTVEGVNARVGLLATLVDAERLAREYDHGASLRVRTLAMNAAVVIACCIDEDDWEEEEGEGQELSGTGGDGFVVLEEKKARGVGHEKSGEVMAVLVAMPIAWLERLAASDCLFCADGEVGRWELMRDVIMARRRLARDERGQCDTAIKQEEGWVALRPELDNELAAEALGLQRDVGRPEKESQAARDMVMDGRAKDAHSVSNTQADKRLEADSQVRGIEDRILSYGARYTHLSYLDGRRIWSAVEDRPAANLVRCMVSDAWFLEQHVRLALAGEMKMGYERLVMMSAKGGLETKQLDCEQGRFWIPVYYGVRVAGVLIPATPSDNPLELLWSLDQIPLTIPPYRSHHYLASGAREGASNAWGERDELLYNVVHKYPRSPVRFIVSVELE